MWSTQDFRYPYENFPKIFYKNTLQFVKRKTNVLDKLVCYCSLSLSLFLFLFLSPSLSLSISFSPRSIRVKKKAINEMYSINDGRVKKPCIFLCAKCRSFQVSTLLFHTSVCISNFLLLLSLLFVLLLFLLYFHCAAHTYSTCTHHQLLSLFYYTVAIQMERAFSFLLQLLSVFQKGYNYIAKYTMQCNSQHYLFAL